MHPRRLKVEFILKQTDFLLSVYKFITNLCMIQVRQSISYCVTLTTEKYSSKQILCASRVCLMHSPCISYKTGFPRAPLFQELNRHLRNSGFWVNFWWAEREILLLQFWTGARELFQEKAQSQIPSSQPRHLAWNIDSTISWMLSFIFA